MSTVPSSAPDIESGFTRSTWGTFDRLLERSTTFQRNTNVAFDDTIPEAQRLTALAKLRERLNQDPARQLIRAKLARQSKGTLMDELTIQVTILSTRTFDWFTPVHSRHHILLVPLVCLVAGYIFSFMTGAYPTAAGTQGTCLGANPLTMIRWFGGSVGAPGWCLPGEPWQFSTAFLHTFGGRFDPDMKKYPYEWFTGPFLHQHFIHLFSNVSLLLLIGCEVERRYGVFRTLLLLILTLLGGGVLSATAEAHCAVIVGLSGVVFGFLPLYAIDIIKHWRDMTAPALQVFFFIVFFITFGASIIRQPTGISHWSHVGGLVMGIFPALLYQYHILPHHDDTDSVHHLRVHPTTLERLEMLLPIVAGFFIIAYFLIFFLVFYLKVYPGVVCPSV